MFKQNNVKKTKKINSAQKNIKIREETAREEKEKS